MDKKLLIIPYNESYIVIPYQDSPMTYEDYISIRFTCK